MTLEELGKQYLQKSIQLNERICTLREELKKLSPERRHKMNRRLNSLSASALQCRKTAEQLLHYYERSGYHGKIDG